MSGFLQQACAEAHERVAEARGLRPLAELRTAPHRPRRSLAQALAAPGCQLIAELKRASPSQGHLAWIPDPVARAQAYVQGGAAAVSVLIEPAHFRGSLADAAMVAEGVSVPVLRKDFVVDAYQVWEARAVGADAVLLIVAALDDATLAELLAETHRADLEALVEVHDVAEAARARQALTAAAVARPIVGINARDLTTLTVDPSRFAACADAVPQRALTVAESGVAGPADVARAASAGADAVLVGEHLVRTAQPTAEVARLVAVGRHAGAS